MYPHVAAVSATPRPIFTASGTTYEGVTNPSRNPEPARRIAHPTATVIASRAAFPTAWNLVMAPGTSSAQKILSPAATEINTAVSSGRPCGKMKRKKCHTPPYSNTTAADVPNEVAFCHRTHSGYTPVMPEMIDWKAIQALFAHTDMPNSRCVS